MTRTAQTLTIRRVKHLPGVQVESSGDMLERNKSNTYPVRRSTNGPVVKCSHAVQLFHAKQKGRERDGERRRGGSGMAISSSRDPLQLVAQFLLSSFCLSPSFYGFVLHSRSRPVWVSMYGLKNLTFALQVWSFFLSLHLSICLCLSGIMISIYLFIYFHLSLSLSLSLLLSICLPVCLSLRWWPRMPTWLWVLSP